MWQNCHHKSSHGLPPISQDRHYPDIQFIPRNMHTVFALLCFVVVIHWLIFPYPSGLLHWHCGNLTIAPVPAKQPWWICINTSCEFIMNDCITTTQQSTTKPCAYFLGYTVCCHMAGLLHWHCGNLTIAPVPAKQPWWICINTSCEFIMNDCITTTQQSTTKPCAYFLGYTVDDSRPSKRCQRWRRRADIPTTASTMNKVGINSLVLWNNSYHAWMIFDTFLDRVL